MPKKASWTDQDLIEKVPMSTCWSDLWERLGLNPKSGNTSPRKRVKELNLDTTHFDKNHYNRGIYLDQGRTHKICNKCSLLKDISNFSFKNKELGQRSSTCSSCHIEYRKSHYEENKELYIEKSKNWRLARKIEFYRWLQKQRCKDCGNEDFRVLEFDHLYDKEFQISEKLGKVSLEVLKKEIDKCEIVCGNCHKIRTAERGNFYNYLD
jgi:hypothetical protein